MQIWISKHRPDIPYPLLLSFIRQFGKTEKLNPNQEQVDVGNLRNGIYVVELKNKEGIEKTRLLIPQ